MIRGRAAAIEAALAAVLALALGLVAVGPVLGRLDAAWFSGDMLAQYVVSENWGVWGFDVTTHYGFPEGLDWNLFPIGDVLTNALTRLGASVTGSPFIAVNLLILLSFPVVGALALLTVRMVGLTGPVAVALALALTVTPYHFVRALVHVNLGMMVSVFTGMLLVLLIASGRLLPALERRKGRVSAYLGVTALCVATAWMGFYYAAFALILGLAALGYRFTKGDGFREIARAGVPLAAIAGLVLVGQIPPVLARTQEVVSGAVAERDPIESFHYAGVLFAAVLPGPVSILPAYRTWLEGVFAEAPPLENISEGNFGTIVTTVCLAIYLGGMVWRSRHRLPVCPPDASGVTPGLVGWLLGFSLLFFVPWGANFVLAVMVTPQIRAWNRLLPFLLILFVLGAATIVRDFRWLKSERTALVVGGVIVLVAAFDVVIPASAGFATSVRADADLSDRARTYAVEVNRAIPGRCGVLQLPVLAFPEPDDPPGERTGYEHLLLSLTNPGKSWSYGAVKGTVGSEWQQDLTVPPSLSDLKQWAQKGFCGVELDRGAYDALTAQTLENALTQNLGPPVAVDSVGGWVTWRLGAA